MVYVRNIDNLSNNEEVNNMEKQCGKIDSCTKISMVLDHDMLDGQYAEVIKKVCNKCNEKEGGGEI